MNEGKDSKCKRDIDKEEGNSVKFKTLIQKASNLFKGVKLALKLSGKDKYLTLKEAEKIMFSAHWLKRKLIKELK